MQRTKRSFNINYPMLFRVLGWLLMIEAAFMLMPMGVALYYGEDDAMSFAVSALFTLVAGALMNFGARPRRSDLGRREGILLTASVWVVFSLFGLLPFVLSATPYNFNDAFFEAMSAFTTSGLSILPSIDHLSHGIYFWRCLMQWLGGMGIMLFTLAILPMLNSAGGIQMFNAEATGITHDKLRPRVSQTSKRLWVVYVLLTAVLCVLLWLGPMSMFDSVCHAFSTMSTGGFSTSDASVGAWNTVYVKVVLTIFMVLGSINFALIFRASTGHFESLWKNETLRAFVGLVIGATLLFIVIIVVNGKMDGWQSVTIDPLFQIVSVVSSTGYVVNGFMQWGVLAIGLVMVLMFFGGCAGSTSGGAKIDRAIYLGKFLGNEVRRCLHPNRIYSVSYNGQVQSPQIVAKVAAFLFLYVIVILAGALMLMAFGCSILDAFFSSLECVSNMGLGIELTDGNIDYQDLPTLGKYVMSLLMLTGRLEVFTVILIFTPGFWHK